MRAMSVKHAEYEILKYLLTGRGSHLATCEGLTDLMKSLGAEHKENGYVIKEVNEAKDKPAQKRCIAAIENISGILLNMLVKRTAYLPEEHVNNSWNAEDCVAMIKRAAGDYR